MQGSLGVLVLGCGQRAEAYARFFADIAHQLDCPIAILAIAEPNRLRRDAFARRYGVPDSNCYEDASLLCHALAETETIWASRVHAALICTQDALHVTCIEAVLATKLGRRLHLLCEKPLARTQEACLSLQACLQDAWTSADSRLFATGHVLRYNAHNKLLKSIVDSNELGQILLIQHTEPVGHAHFAHSYVRGHWRRTQDAGSALLAKCCHDVDLLNWLVQGHLGAAVGNARRPTVVSLGSQSHFVQRRKPREAGDATQCLACPLVDRCAYSAKKIYLDNFVKHGELRGYQKAILEGDMEDLANITKALRITRYGRCVYECDNDVCDVQSVLLSYPAATDQEYAPTSEALQVSFSMISTSEAQCVRKTVIYGSRGELHANGHDAIQVHSFETGETTKHDIPVFEGTKENNAHGGGDYGLILQFLIGVLAVERDAMAVGMAQSTYLGCTLEEIVQSHLLVFAAEEARLTRSLVEL